MDLAHDELAMTYAKYRATTAHTGDILLGKPSSLEGRLICHGTRSRYSHAALVGWNRPSGRRNGHGVLMIAETRQHRNARLIAMSGEIREFPGFYDVYRIKTPWDHDSAWDFMCRAAGAQYGYRHLTRAWLRKHLGYWIPAIRNSDDPQWPRDCSALVHAAYRIVGGLRIKPLDCDVYPGDWADPAITRYVCTLYPDPDPAEAPDVAA
jgi:hypothetical protein